MIRSLATKEEFDSLLTEAGDKLVVVDFMASWCPPCRMIAPKLEKLAKDRPTIEIVKIDVDVNEEVAASQNIEAMPTFLLFKSQKRIDEVVGADFDKLVKLVEKHV